LVNNGSVEQARLPRSAVIGAVVAAVVALGLYVRTLHPGVGPSLDSIELQIATLVNGVIHPPGSPQYLVLGKLAMGVLPGPNAAYRLNLLSAVSAAATVGVVYPLCYRLTRNLFASGYGSLGLAVAVRFWYQASIAELYTLNGFYVALVAYLLVAWNQTGKRGLYWAAAAVYAVSFGHHVSMILLLPAFLYTVWVTDRGMLLRPRNLVLTAGIVALAAAQYVVIPLRVASAPPFCNYCPSNAALPSYLSGGPFKAQFFAVGGREALARLAESVGQWNAQFMPWGYALGIIGGWELARRQSKLAWVLLVGLLAEYVFVIGYAIPDWHDFLTPVYVIFAPLMGYGGLVVWRQVEQLLPDGRSLARRGSAAAVVCAGVVSLAVIGYGNWPLVDQSDNVAYEVNGRALLEQTQPGAWLVMPLPDSPAFYYSWAVRYLAFAQEPPSDLIAVAPPQINPPPGPEPYYRAWADAEAQLTTDGLRAGHPQLLVVDSTEVRFGDLGMLPLCTVDGQSIAGYEIVAVLVDGEPVPIIDGERWAAVREYVVFGGAEAHCPP
jgi:hypothetical protein